MDNEYSISTDQSKLELNTIHDFLCNKSYWAKGRSYENVEMSINNSLCYGLYDQRDKMLGFARVISDKVVFAYMMDVFIVEAYQGRGLGKMLINNIINSPDLQVKFWLLATDRSHEFYQKLGFKPLPEPGRFLAIKDETIN